MKPRRCRTATVVAVLALTVGGCGGSEPDERAASASAPTTSAVTAGDSGEPAETEPADGLSEPAVSVGDSGEPAATEPAPPATAPVAPAGDLRDGPVTLIALGDSLTAGDGDDSGVGYVGRLAESIGAVPGRSDVSVVNLGASGWDSTMMVDGQEGTSAELAAALEAVEAAVAGGRVVLATVLIGSNDLWYLYEYGPPEGTPLAAEDAAAEIYRTNLDRTVSELSQAGALVVIGLPDDQSLRPGVADIDQLHIYLPNVTVEEVQLMSAMAGRLGRVAEEVAAVHGVPTVDTNAPFWADTSKMAADGIHPNGDGYADLAELLFTVVRDLL